MKTSSRRFLPNPPKQNQQPDSTLSPNKDSARARLHHRRHHSIVCISGYYSRHSQNLIPIFPQWPCGGLSSSQAFMDNDMTVAVDSWWWQYRRARRCEDNIKVDIREIIDKDGRCKEPCTYLLKSMFYRPLLLILSSFRTKCMSAAIHTKTHEGCKLPKRTLLKDVYSKEYSFWSIYK